MPAVMHACSRARVVLALVCACAWMLASPGAAHAAMTIDSGPTVRVNPYQTTIWWYSSSTGSSELRWDSAPHASFSSYPNDVSNTGTTLGALHSRTISNLTAGTYFFQVRSVGAAGTATSATHSFVVDPPSAATPAGTYAVDGQVHALLANGTKTYLGGDFTEIGPRTGSGIEVSPATAVRLPGTPQVAGNISVAVPDGSGGLFIAGGFVRVGGLPRPSVAHLLPDGGIDPFFNAGASAPQVGALAISGTKLYVGGSFFSWNGNSRTGVAALDTSTGALDMTFSPGTGGTNVNTMVVSGTKLYLGGSFTTFAGASRPHLVALDATTGTLDTTFLPGTGTDSNVYSLAVNGTKLYLGGGFSNYNGTSRSRVAAVDLTTAALDTTFNPGTGVSAGGFVTTMAISGTKLYLGGTFTSYNGTARSSVAAVDLTTAVLDTTFAPGTGIPAGYSTQALTVIGTKLYIGGTFPSYNGTTRNGIAAVDATTAAVDATFDPGNGTNSGVVLAAIGTRLYVGGQFSVYDGTSRNGLAAIDSASGALDATFNPGVGTGPGINNPINAMAISGSRLYIGGSFTSFNGTGRAYLTAVDTTTGAIDTTFNTPAGPNGLVSAIVVSGTKIYVAGQFTTYGGVARKNLAAADAATNALDTTFVPPGVGLDSYVNALAVSGSRLYVGGAFTTYNAVAANHLMAVDTTTAALDATFATATGANANVWCLLVNGTKLYVGGGFTTYNGTARTGLAAVDTATAALDTTFNPGSGAPGTIMDFALSGSKLYISGTFSSYNGIARRNVAVIDATTAALDRTFNPGTDAGNGTLPAVLPTASMLYLGSYTSLFNQIAQGTLIPLALPSSGSGDDVAGLTITVQPQQSVAPYQDTVWWTTSATSSSELVWDTTSHTAWTDYEYDVSNTATALGTVHSRTISNLPQGTYYYRVRSRNAAGQQVTSAEYSFTIGPADAITPIGANVFAGAVYGSALDATGTTLYVGGAFIRVAKRAGSAIPIDSSTGVGLRGAPQAVDDTRVVIPDGAGGWFIGGDFTYVGGLPRQGVAHLLPDGGVDPTWSTGGALGVKSLVLSGGVLYVGGSFSSTFAGSARAYLAAVDATTGALTSWNPGASGPVYAMKLVGTTLYVGGSFATLAGQARANIGALTLSTGVATAWNPGASSVVYTLEASATTLYVGGNFTTYGGQARSYIAATTLSDGSTSTWNPGVSGGVGPRVQVLTLSGTTLYVGGYFTTAGGAARANIAAIDTTTAIATSWNPGTNSYVYAIEVGASTVRIGGSFGTAGGATRANFAEIDRTTGVATAFNPAPSNSVYAIVTSGATTYLAGYMSGVGGVIRNRGAALDARTGELLDWDPNVGGNSVVTILPSGTTIYIGGTFTTVGGSARANIAAVDSVSGAVAAWNPGASSSVQTVALSGTTLYVGGYFTTLAGVARTGLGAVSTTTGVATAFAPTLTASGGPVVDEIVVSGTTVYVGGWFTTAAGSARGYGASFTTAGALNAWNPASDDEITDMAISGSTVYIACTWCTTLGGQPRDSLGAVDATTGLATAWNPVVDSQVYDLAVSGSAVWVGGVFDTVGGVAHRSIAKVDATTGVAAAWDPDLDYYVESVTATPGGVFVGGLPAYTNQVSVQGGALFNTCDRTTFCGDEELRDYVSISAPTSVALGLLAVDTSATASLPVTVQSNALLGYTLTATDTSDTQGLPCSSGGCTGTSIVDWTGAPSTPTTWADTGANYGFGVTVLTTGLGTKSSSWGTGSTVGDYVNNKYVGLRSTSSATVQSNPRFLGTAADVTTLGLRARVGATQLTGTYSGTITLTAVANP
jgi:hypothetical protein